MTRPPPLAPPNPRLPYYTVNNDPPLLSLRRESARDRERVRERVARKDEASRTPLQRALDMMWGRHD